MLLVPAPYRITDLESRSISPGNPTGERAGVPTGQTRHCVFVPAGGAFTLADIEGPGMVRSLWLTFPDRSPETLRSVILRAYWDDAPSSSVLAPIGDFFGLAHGRAAHFTTPYLGVSEGKGFHCFFPMPFAKRCRMVFDNDSPNDVGALYYQINYTLGDEIAPDTAYFHAHFRRETPAAGEPFRLLETSGARGAFVGMHAGALPRTEGTWREGDFRFYFDREERASMVGTGWSDWFLSGWGLGIHQSMYSGSSYQVRHPEYHDKYFCSSYRFHVLDPIYFWTGLRVEHDQRGFEGFWERQPREDDWTSTVYWYQHPVHPGLPDLPGREKRIGGIALTEWEQMR
jgi:hypothetical protein